MDNVEEFDKINIKDFDIVLVVIFDGIDKINNTENDNQKNMISLFKEYDIYFNNLGKDSLEY